VTEVHVAGLITVASEFGPKETMDRLEKEIRGRSLTVFARIDHAAGATEAGLKLRPMELIIFGNARGGTPLMQASQTSGIDLPLKILVWEDAESRTSVSYNDPGWIVERHGLRVPGETVDNLKAALKAISTKATARD
jgi:uncharacterized protein (DUF302 family)